MEVYVSYTTTITRNQVEEIDGKNYSSSYNLKVDLCFKHAAQLSIENGADIDTKVSIDYAPCQICIGEVEL